jgi:hypothetical protein
MISASLQQNKEMMNKTNTLQFQDGHEATGC